MADWVAISDSQVDPDAPITSELGYAFRDNPIALAEGAVGAPRITRSALLNMAAGGGNLITQNSFNFTAGASSGGVSQVVLEVSCFLPGAISVFTNLSTVSSTGARGVTVSRIRNGTAVIIASYDTVGTRSDNVSIQVGDKVRVSAQTPESSTITGSAGVTIGNDSTGVVVL